jgi:LacI family transcriptional regulator
MPTRDFPVTLQQVADAAGVSRAAASMALKNHPRIGAETKKRVQETVARLGYRPDPRMTALAAYREGKGKAHYRESLLFLQLVPEERKGIDAPLYDGFRARAEALGYTVEKVVCAPVEKELRVVARNTHAKGIRGIVLYAGAMEAEALPFPWENFFVVQVASHPTSRFLPCLTSENYRSTVLAMTHIAALGYRRPGLWLRYGSAQSNEQYAVGGFRQGCLQNLGSDELPVLRETKDGVSASEVIKWAETANLDCIIDSGTGENLAEMHTLLRGFPNRFGFVALDVPMGNPMKVSGILKPRRMLGSYSVDHLHSLLVINQRPDGNHTPPSIHFVGEWLAGETLPKRDSGIPLDSTS